MARKVRPLPNEVQGLTSLAGRGSIALAAPDDLKSYAGEITRAQRAKLSTGLLNALGLHEKRGHPEGVSPYAMDDHFVRLALCEIRAEPGLDPTTAARRVLAMVDAFPGQRAKLVASGMLYSEAADVERIADKVRAADRSVGGR